MNVNTPTAAPMVFFIPSHRTIYAWAKQKNGEWVTEFGQKTLDTVCSVYPDTVLIPFFQAQQMENIGYRRPWVEISEARYISQQGTLPPMDWRCGGGGESFKSMELSGGDVTAIFVRYGTRYFECHDLHTLTHRELMESVATRYCLGKSLTTGH